VKNRVREEEAEEGVTVWRKMGR